MRTTACSKLPNSVKSRLKVYEAFHGRSSYNVRDPRLPLPLAAIENFSTRPPKLTTIRCISARDCENLRRSLANAFLHQYYDIYTAKQFLK
jgi:hypothetical protein